jgi:hypothetical protein
MKTIVIARDPMLKVFWRMNVKASGLIYGDE